MRDTCVSSQSIDLDLTWQAGRLSLRPLIDEIEGIPPEDVPDDIGDQVASLCDADNGLTEEIKTTPTMTIEGALAVIEAIDHFELNVIGVEDPWTVGAVRARERAVATIRRCLADREG